jgi:hypothetical protein
MRYELKREIYRSVRARLLPRPEWEAWQAMPECRTGCQLYVNGVCCWNGRATQAGSPCVPCCTVGLEKLNRARKLERKG